MADCTFHLEDNQNAIYFAGQQLRGKIALTLDRPKTVRSFILVVFGVAYCHWTESHTETRGYGENRRNVRIMEHFEGKNVYLKSETILFGTKGGPTQEMAAGTYRYDFQCHLPENLPASFEAQLGHIRYHVEAKLDVPWNFDKEFKLQFTVVRNDDLNFYPELKIPMSDEEIKTFCCCCCESDPLNMKAFISCGGFVGGQTIPIRIEYFNKSDVDIERTNIYLRRHIRYNSQTPREKSKTDYEVVEQTYCEGALKMSNKIHEVFFKIPDILVKTNEQFCKIVQVSYDIKITAVAEGFHLNLDMFFPITIGTTPFEMDLESGSSPFAPLIQNTEPSAPPSYEIIKGHEITDLPTPPPSFDEAVKQNGHKIAENQRPVGWTFDPARTQ